MSEQKHHQPNHNPRPTPADTSPLVPGGTHDTAWNKAPKYPNPPDPTNPDPATLREQWRYATREYGRWYSRSWGAAILAGAAFFALGWFIKGENPLHSFTKIGAGRADEGKAPPDEAKAPPA